MYANCCLQHRFSAIQSLHTPLNLMAPPLVIPSTHAGFDRGVPPPGRAKDLFAPSKTDPKAKVNFDYKWMHTLFNRSNFSFTGVYLSHKPKEDDPRWLAVFPKFLEYGWGFFFLWVGYSYRDKKEFSATVFPRNLSLEEASKRGEEHGQLLKARAASYGHEAQGAVIFIDNEDQQEKHPDAKPKPIGGDEPLTPQIVEYYTALFEECRKSGPTGPAVRPGLYAWENPTQRIMLRAVNSDVFLWRCNKMAENPSNPEPTLYDTKTIPGRLISPIKRYPLNAIVHKIDKSIEPGDSLSRTAMIMGRQWCIYSDEEKLEGIPNGVKWLSKCTGMDFDASMVRDPRYPIAEPRVAAVGGIQIRSYFSKEDASMHLEQVYTTSYPVPFPTEGVEELLEPEAPILLTNISTPEVYTLNKGGKLVLITAEATMDPKAPWDWSPPIKILDDTTGPRLRRNRAMAIAKIVVDGKLNTQLYFVAEYHIIMGMRRIAEGPWFDPMPIAEKLELHPFSDLAIVNRGTETVDLFFLDSNGILCTAWHSYDDKDWPARFWKPLQEKPTLMLGGPLIAVSPSDKHVLVFGIGKDLMLYMAVYTAGDKQDNAGKWINLAVVQGLQPRDYKLFAHASLDALAWDEKTVYVASITEVNQPCVYMLHLDAGKWVLRGASDRLYLENELPTNPALIPEAAAKGFVFNPFGDVKLSVLDGALVFWMPRVANSETKEMVTQKALLMRRVLDKEKPYWIRVK